MSFKFRIDTSAINKPDILYFEDATSKNSQFHAVNRSLTEVQESVRISMGKLGGAVTQFIPVIFEDPKRYGYLIEYVFRGGAFGQFPIAALPIRREQPHLVEKARKQALMVASHLMDASYNVQQHTPMSNPLLLHLLVDGQTTIAQMIAERQALPENFLLPASS